MYHYNTKYFEQINTPDKAYWLGFIAADGNIRKDFLRLRIELNIKDYSHLEKFRQNIEGDMPIKDNNRLNNHSCYIDVNCKKMMIDLLKYGITPNKSLTLNIQWCLIPEELHKYVIRGYFDGDGSFNLYDARGYKEWELSFIGTQSILYSFQKFFHKEKKLFSCGNNYRFCYKNKEDIIEVLLLFYNDDIIYLDRKREKIRDFLGSQRLSRDNFMS